MNKGKNIIIEEITNSSAKTLSSSVNDISTMVVNISNDNKTLEQSATRQDNKPNINLTFISLKNKILSIIHEKEFSKLKSLLITIQTNYPAIQLEHFTLEGLSLLHYAAYNNSVEMLKLLLELNFPIDLKNNEYIDEDNIITQGATALILAVQQGAYEAVDCLLENGANIHERYNLVSRVTPTLGLTPLHAAAFRGALIMADRLLQRGAEINSLTKDGLTPLHVAVLRGNTLMVKLLLSKGAMSFIKNNAGLTACDIAISNGNKEIGKVFDNSQRVQAIKYISPICICVLAIIFFI
jgi:ankyrin repeat protein